jgi:hypothetical protein
VAQTATCSRRIVTCGSDLHLDQCGREKTWSRSCLICFRPGVGRTRRSLLKSAETAAIAGGPDAASRERCLRPGASRSVSEPINSVCLLAEIEHVPLGHWLAQAWPAKPRGPGHARPVPAPVSTPFSAISSLAPLGRRVWRESCRLTYPAAWHGFEKLR